MLLLGVVVPLLNGCGPDAKSAATKNKAKLDTALHAASTGVGVPARRLAPIIARENALDAGTASGANSAYTAAANGYTSLYNQVVALEKMTPIQAQTQAASDLSALQSALAMTEGAGIADVAAAAKLFDGSVATARQRLAAATTTQGYFAVDGYLLDQNAAVTQILPDYRQIQALTKLVNTQTANLAQSPGQAQPLQCATEGGEFPGYAIVPAQFWSTQTDYPISSSSGVMVKPAVEAQSYYFSAWPTQALTAFKAARTADDFSTLGAELQAEAGTLTADMNPKALAHDQIAAAVARFQNDVNTYQTEAQANNAFLKAHRAQTSDVPDYTSVWNQTNSAAGFAPPQDFFSNVPDFQVDAKFAQEAALDAKTLAGAQTASDLAALAKTVQQQEHALAFPLLKVKGYYDIHMTLQTLINQGQSTTTDVTYQGVVDKTPNAYEYADDNLRYDKHDTVGIQDAQVRYDQSVYRESFDSSAEATADFQAVEDEAQMFIHNLSAMISNLAQMPKDNAARQAWSMT
ncbi:MAG: hypothetical protein ACRDHE_12930, partial [Ktedonobacterales bacterium]